MTAILRDALIAAIVGTLGGALGAYLYGALS